MGGRDGAGRACGLGGGGQHGLATSNDGGGVWARGSREPPCRIRKRGRTGPRRLDVGALPGPVKALADLAGMAGRQGNVMEVPLGRPVVHAAHVLDEPHVPPNVEKGTWGNGGARGQVRKRLRSGSKLYGVW